MIQSLSSFLAYILAQRVELRIWKHVTYFSRSRSLLSNVTHMFSFNPLCSSIDSAGLSTPPFSAAAPATLSSPFSVFWVGCKVLECKWRILKLRNMVKLTMIARVTDGLPLAEGLDDGRDLKDAEFYKQQVKALFKNLSRGHYEASRMSVETGPYVFQYPYGIINHCSSATEHVVIVALMNPLKEDISLLDTRCLYVTLVVHVLIFIAVSVNLWVLDISKNISYIIEGRVCYLTMCDRAYPKKLAFQYLEELRNEFERVNGSQIETAARPYAFIKFDTFMQKTKKLYQDTHTQRNIAKLNDELYEVHQIMTRNVQEVLGVGEQLDQVSQMSSRLSSESRIYADKARDLNRQVSHFQFSFMIIFYHVNMALIRKWAPVAIVFGVVFVLFWIKNKIW
ncbi:hypothetical protein V8G54_000434 [Vigna mungo]|uniref:Uncharacterized protein n=1 Tax=Vigna mungo TaxID=3915 RepID=A0AAQ3P5M6_VIGMU